MANKIEILVEVDPYGRGSAKIKTVGTEVDNLTAKTNKAGQAGRSALDGFAGGLGIPTSVAAASSAIAAGILLVGNAAKNSSLDAANAQRILKSDAQAAGIAFTAAQAEARAFGDDLALSNTQATLSFTQFIRVVKAAGLTENLTKYRKNFADLAAAYGLQAADVTTLVSQLISGQDEALNRLGLPDPSVLYKKYAAAIGKTVDQLTAEELVRARLLAVTEKGEQFAGAAQERLTQQTGQWATLEKKISEATTALGDFLLKQTVIGELPLLLTHPFDLVPAKQKQLDDARAAQAAAARAKALADSDAYFKRENESSNAPGALRNPFGSFNNRVTLLGADQAAKERENFVSQYTELFKDPRLTTATAIFAEEQFRQIRGIFDPKKSQEIEADFTKFWDKYAKVALGALKTARDAAEKNLATIADRATGGSNPFVKLLTEADERAKELRKTFGVLGESVVKDLLKAEEAFNRQRTLALQLDQELKAAALRREADTLKGFNGISGAEQRRLNQIDSQVSAAESIPGLLAKAEAISRGLVQLQSGQFDAEGKRINPKDALKYELGGKGQDRVNSEIFDMLTKINTGGFGFGSQGGKQAEGAVNAALVRLFDSLAPEMQARIAQGLEGGNQQRTFAGAFRGQAQSFQDAIREEIAKAKVADQAVSSVREDIARIEEARRQGLDSREADARLLATTGALSPAEQTADIRQARIEALRREADRSVTAQTDATKAVDSAREATDRLTTAIDKLAEESRKPENRRLLVEIQNRAKADVRSELYGGLGPQD